jgi:hypothetical protein
MRLVIEKLHRLSPNQLRALRLLAKAPKGIINSTDSGAKIGLKGKNLGGLFSSLSRQRIGQERLVIPWGRPKAGKGLRWKLNQNLVGQKELLTVTQELLA